MTNEIKVGDTVRVSKAAPNMYIVGIGYGVIEADSKVKDLDESNALIKWKDNFMVIPTKYLVKVGGEEKEPKFKVGDKVIPKLPFAKKILTVLGYDDKMPCLVMIGEGEFINEKHLDPYTEPTEDADIKETAKEYAETMSRAISDYGKALREYSVIDTYWDAYTADLAKEIAVKAAYSTYTAEEVAEYAVKVAKAVVEELKKK